MESDPVDQTTTLSPTEIAANGHGSNDAAESESRLRQEPELFIAANDNGLDHNHANLVDNGGRMTRTATGLMRTVKSATISIASVIGNILTNHFSKVMIALTIWQLFFKPGGSHEKGGSTGSKRVVEFQPKQHFVFSPFGYSCIPPKVNMTRPTVLVVPNKSFSLPEAHPMQGALNHLLETRGRFDLDTVALQLALQSTSTCSARAASTVSVASTIGEVVVDAKEGVNLLDESRTLERNDELKPATIVVLNLRLGPDPRSEINFVRDAVTFLIGSHRTEKTLSSMEVVVILESSGGMMHSYGLLAEQFKRLRSEPGITLTVACDMVAASGGYMIASTASPGQLLASPFALIGSIGVTSPTAVNLREALEPYGVKFVQVKSGRRKRNSDPVFGDISDEDIQNLQENLDRSHSAFLEYILEFRGEAIPDHAKVMSGDDWLGKDALKLGLVDRLVTSDVYLGEKQHMGDRVIVLRGIKGSDDNNPFWLRLLKSMFDTSSDNQVSIPKQGFDVGITFQKVFELIWQMAHPL